jgi:hypothetical membrane protein
VTPPLTALVNVIVATQQPDYSYLRDYVSDLTARGRPYSEVLRVWWGVFPLLFGPFVIAVAAGLRGHRFGRALPVLLGIFALCIGLCGVFRYDPPDPERTFASRMHIRAGDLAFHTLFLSPLALWLATRQDIHWDGFRRYSLFLQAGVIVVLFFVLVHPQVMIWSGLAERIFWGVYCIWIVGLALKLRSISEPRCLSGPCARRVLA